MRFERIDLLAYGNFTAKTLDFSDPTKLVHVIYGPNEAGKSTLKDAIEELLFGFDVRTKYGFKHPYPQMALGAMLVNAANARISFVRKKRRSNQLFDETGAQLPMTALAPFVGGLTRSTYQNQFCLSRQSLIDGSTEIANGNGEVGESLYNAALGNMNLSEIIVRLEKQRDDLFTPIARNKPLNAAISAYEAQRMATRGLVIRPDAWQRVVIEREKLAQEIENIKQRIGAAAAVSGLLTTLKACYPNYNRLCAAREALDTAGNEPHMAPDFVDDAARLLGERADVESAAADCKRRIARLNDEIGPEQSDPLIDQRAVIEDLTGRVVTYRKGRSDLERLDLRGHAQRNADDAQRDLNVIWLGLDLEEARKRVVPPDVQTRGNALVPEVVRLNELCRLAAAEEQDLLDQIAEVDGELAGLAPARELDALHASAAAASAEPRLDADICEAERDAARDSSAASMLLTALGRFRGSLAELMTVTLPLPATVDRHGAVFDVLRGRAERSTQDIEAEHDVHAAAAEQLDAIAREHEIRTLADLTAARAERDGRFDVLQGRWHAGAAASELDVVASEYRPAVDAADSTADILRNEAERVARVATLEARRDAATAKIARLNDALIMIARERDAALSAWDAEWTPLDIVPLSPGEMRAWITTAADVRRQASIAESAAAKHSGLVTRRLSLRASLVDALLALGAEIPTGEPIEPVLGLVRRIIDDADALESTLERLTADKARHGRKLAKHRRNTVKAEKDLQVASEAFAAILERLSLPSEMPAAAFADTLAKIASFHAFDKRARDNKSRADGIERENAAFSAAVLAFTEAYARDLTDLAAPSPDIVAERLHTRLLAAQTAFDTRAARLQQVATERSELDEETAKCIALDAAIAAIMSRERITVDALPAHIERSRILNDHKQTIATETQHLESAVGESLAECDVKYGDRDRAKLDSDLAVAKSDVESLNGERDKLNPQLWELDEQLRRMDSSSDAAEAETMLSALGAKVDLDARRWVEVALALHVLKEQIRIYAEANQGTLITCASHYLNLLTDGVYVKLRTVKDGENNILEAVRSDDQGLEIDALSEGTRDQLFLALRLAALEQYLQEAESQPLILDDTFIAFDDPRTVRAFRALAEIAGQTQVLYFTHHAGCVDAARVGIPGLQLAVHNLHDVASIDERELATG